MASDMVERVTSDSNDYHHTFYGILNPQGRFWTPLPFRDEEAARRHLSATLGGRDASRHRIVPVRVELTLLDQESSHVR